MAGPNAKYIADLILMRVGEPQLSKSRCQPFASRGFSPGRRCNRGYLKLQVFQFAGMGAEPRKRLMNPAQPGKARHLLLGRAQGLRFT